MKTNEDFTKPHTSVDAIWDYRRYTHGGQGRDIAAISHRDTRDHSFHILRIGVREFLRGEVFYWSFGGASY